ncbi:NusG domain II-containing protein [Ignavigranum ruoffiae]|uniref:NusG domain II-containing protein n=1 Tax=Ignavigranum ruoffiae TaxID=89093 RepID=UPI002353F199|nr:NusG domain II-containing protein [Ignavigranum ruoffiae]
MKNIFHLLKPFDYIFILLALMLSFLPNLITGLQFQQGSDTETLVAIVKIKGEEVDRFTLGPGQAAEKTYHPNPGQYNIIQVEDHKIRIKEDNSPDQVGVLTGWISKPGQTAICLPHQLIIEVLGLQEEDELILPL